MDFDGDKSPQLNTGAYLDNIKESDTAQEILDQLVTEDAILYNPSYFLCDEIYKFGENLNGHKIFQVLPIPDSTDYLIVG
jgi:hypothetical protein